MTATEATVRARVWPDWILLWIAALILLIERDLRSIGDLERALPISVGLVKGFWLADLALLIPIIAALASGRLRELARSRTARWIAALLIYGIALALAKQNQFSPIMHDVRVFLALLCGVALVEAAPTRPRQLAGGLTWLSTIFVALSVILVLALPAVSSLATPNDRATAESAFLLIGPPLVVSAPAILLATLAGDRRLMTIAWSTGGVLAVESIVLLQTRSLAATVLLSLSFAWLGTKALAGRRQIPDAQRRPVLGRRRALAVAALLIVFVAWRWGGLTNFLGRINIALQLQNDETWLIRADEIVQVFRSMTTMDYLTGVGLGPTPHLNALGVPVVALHIGMLNVWWRFGAVTFVGVLLATTRLMARWVVVTRAVYRQLPVRASDVALLIAAPGALTLAAAAFISGGWSTTSMLGLGMTWGAYRTVASAAARAAPTRSR